MSDGQVVIDITADASEYNKAIDQMAATTKSKAASLGPNLSTVGSSLTKFVTAPALAAGAALGAIALSKGFERLEAIDSARVKLKALGHDAAGIDTLMNNALESVKGTAYGLGEAATVAASASAAGVKSGEDMTRYLSLITDASAVAGVEFNDMGAIFNKVQSQSKATTQEFNQLAERGIPIFQWVADEMDMSMEDVRKALSDGAVSTEVFLSAVEKNIGGAAKTIGSESFSGALANIGAALSRIGANFLDAGGQGGGFFSQIKPLMVEAMGLLDGLEDSAAEFGVAFGQAFASLVEKVRDLIKWFSDLSPEAQKLVTTIAGIAIAAGPVLSVFGKLVTWANNVKTAIAGLTAAQTAQKAATEALAIAEEKDAAAKDASATASLRSEAASAKESVTTSRIAIAKEKENLARLKNAGGANAEAIAKSKSVIKTELENVVTQKATQAKAQEALATQASTAATTASSAATNTSFASRVKETASTVANTASTAANTVAKGLYTAATSVATVATTVFATALRAIPFVAIAGAVMGLVSVIGNFISGAEQAESPMNRLTKASQQQKEKVEGLQAEYDNLVEAQGENSDAALSAKAALDEETAAFEATKQTTSDFIKECDDLVSSHRAVVAELEKGVTEADSQAGSLLHLAQEYERLAGMENRSETDKARLAVITERLNKELGEGTVAYNAQTDSIESNAEAVNALVKAETDRLRYAAQSEKLSGLYEEDLRLTGELEDAKKELTNAEENATYITGQYGEKINLSSGQIRNLSERIETLNGDIATNNSEIQKTEKAISGQIGSEIALAAAIEDVKNGVNAETAAKEHGVDVAEISGAIAAEEEEAQKALAEQYDETTQSVLDYIATHPSFQEALSTSGVSIDDFSQHLIDQGISMDDAAKKIQGYQDQITSAFDEITISQEKNATKAAEVYLHNLDVTRNWSDNLAFLANESSLNFNEGFIGAVEKGGVEQWGYVIQELTDAARNGETIMVNDAALSAQEFVDQWAAAPPAAQEQMLAEAGLFNDVGNTFNQEAAQGMDDSASLVSDAAGASAQGAGAAYNENLSAALAQSPEVVQQHVADLESRLQAAEGAASTSGAATGSNYASSLSSAISSSPAEVQTYIADLEGKLGAFQGDLGTTGTDSGTAYTTGIASGLNAGIGGITSATTSISSKIKTSLNTAVAAARSIGQNVSAGMAQGIRARAGEAIAAAADLAHRVAEAARVQLDVHSPSRVFKDIGKNVVLGFIEGVKALSDKAKYTMDLVFGEIRKQEQESFDKSIQANEKQLRNELAHLNNLRDLKAAHNAEIVHQEALRAQALADIAGWEEKEREAQTKVINKHYDDIVKHHEDILDDLERESKDYFDRATKRTQRMQEDMAKANEAMSDALTEALKGNAEKAKESLDEMYELIGTKGSKNVQALTADLIKRADKMDALNERLDDAKQKLEALKDIDELGEDSLAKALAGDVDGLENNLEKLYETISDSSAVKKLGDSLLADANKAAILSEKLSEAKQKLEAAKKTMTDYSASVASSLSADTKKVESFKSAGDYLSQLKQRLSKAKDLSFKVKKMAAMGIPQAIIDEVLAMGIEGGNTAADYLLTGMDAETAQEIRNTYAEIDSVSDSLGQNLAKQYYQAGVDAAQGLVNGLESEKKVLDKQISELTQLMLTAGKNAAKGLVAGLESEKAALEKVMTSLASTLTNTIKRELKIQSPSKVMEQLAAFVPAGIGQGIAKNTDKAVDEMKSMVEALEEELAFDLPEVQAAISFEVDRIPDLQGMLSRASVGVSARETSVVRGIIAQENTAVVYALSEVSQEVRALKDSIPSAIKKNAPSEVEAYVANPAAIARAMNR